MKEWCFICQKDILIESLKTTVVEDYTLYKCPYCGHVLKAVADA